MGPEGAEGPMGDALRWREGAAERAEGRLDAAIGALGRALNELAEAEQETGRALEALRFDPGALERTEERLFAIRGLARKHSVAPEALADHAATLRARLQALDGSGARLDGLRRTLAEAEAGFAAAAATLTASRTRAAARLDAAMARELPPLKLDRARFATAIAPGASGPEGADEVTFTVATNPGAAPGALNRIASGGELSRFLLALKVCLTARNEGLVMIFDEIDRGVGGATADAVGRRLAALAEGAQILVVTHAPQVAARAAHHWRVEKRQGRSATRTAVTELGPAERVDEIARMLAGDTVTAAARAAAEALIG
jgi:DNA repair protein RecN (Recombination protein N)